MGLGGEREWEGGGGGAGEIKGLGEKPKHPNIEKTGTRHRAPGPAPCPEGPAGAVPYENDCSELAPPATLPEAKDKACRRYRRSGQQFEHEEAPRGRGLLRAF